MSRNFFIAYCTATVLIMVLSSTYSCSGTGTTKPQAQDDEYTDSNFWNPSFQHFLWP